MVRDKDVERLQRQLAVFHSQEAKSINDRFRHVENIIGKSHHSPTEGYHCELLLKKYLKENLPGRFSVDTGFIRCAPREHNGSTFHASPQIDILIHDIQSYAPIYRLGDCVIVEPESVVAIIEVKKTLNSNTLKEALENIALSSFISGLDRIYTPERIFTGIFSFQSRLKPNSQTFANRFSSCVKGKGILPRAVVCLDRFFIDCQWDGRQSLYSCNSFNAQDGDNNMDYSLQYFLFACYSQAHLSSTSLNCRFAMPNVKKCGTFKIRRE